MDMMYMPDALEAVVQLMEADSTKLMNRNAFNVTAMSVDPEAIADAIRSVIPTFTLTYEVDPVRQAIAESWPNSIDATAAKEQWGFNPKYDLKSMTEDMLKKVN
jgi:nucleoside-diphosphate-sugar epimerase